MQSQNYKKEFSKLPYGKFYLVKGNSNKIAWLLRGEPNVCVFTGKNLGELTNIILYKPTNYLVHVNNISRITVPEEKIHLPKLARVFISFSMSDSPTAAENKLYKKYESEYYQLLNYSSVRFSKELSLAVKYELTIAKFKGIGKKKLANKLKEYENYPISYEDLMDDLDSLKLLINTENISVPELILELCSTKNFNAVIKMRSLSQVILDSYFKPPFRSFIAALSNDYSKDFKLAAGLYNWYKYFYFKYGLKWNYDSDILVLIFFTWVHRATVKYQKFGKAGLSMFTPSGMRKNYPIVFFSPSIKAIEELNNLD